MVPAKKNLNVVAAYSDSESESESDHSWGGYVCELDTDGIDSSDDEHVSTKNTFCSLIERCISIELLCNCFYYLLTMPKLKIVSYDLIWADLLM